MVALVKFSSNVNIDETDDREEVGEYAARQHQIEKHFWRVELQAPDEHPPIGDQDTSSGHQEYASHEREDAQLEKIEHSRRDKFKCQISDGFYTLSFLLPYKRSELE